MTKPNNPYDRPINATRSEGQMLQSEFYGERAGDKKLAGVRDQQVSPASRFVGRAVAVPVDMDAVMAKKPKPAPSVVIESEPLEPIPPIVSVDTILPPPPRPRGRPKGSKDSKPRLTNAEIDQNREAMIASITEDDLFG